MKQASFYCPQCQQTKLFQAEGMNHVAHLLASVFLCGLWAPIWALLAISHRPLYRCSNCGFGDAVEYLMDPGRRHREQQYAAERRRIRAEGVGQDSFGSRLADKIGSNPLAIGAVIVAVIVTVFAGAMFIERSRRQNTAPPAVTTPTPFKISPAIEQGRRDFIIRIEKELGRRYPGLEADVSGNQLDTLFVRADTADSGLLSVVRALLKNDQFQFRKLRVTGKKYDSTVDLNKPN